MEIIFWICWIAELIVVLWWIITDAQLKHISINPYSLLSLLYLALVLTVRLVFHAHSISNKMVIVPAIPLVGLLLIIVIHRFSGSKWN